MAEMGKYCKAYYAEQFGVYGGWEDKRLLDAGDRAGRAEPADDDGPATGSGDEVLYLQENYVVTAGIFIDEHVVFDRVTDEWKRFCSEVLEFEIPAETSSSASAE